jgi:Spy/CpxP family protein refolding chaperone
MGPNGQTQRPPAAFRFNAPIGLQARFTYMGITSHKDELGLTDAQVKSVEDLFQKSQTDSMAREQKSMALRQAVQDLADADPVDMTKVEAAVNAYQKAQGEQMLSDIRLNVALNSVLTAEQREKLKDLPPSFGMGGPGMRPPMPPRGQGGMPGGMPGMPGMPGGPPPPSGQPGAPPPPPPAP